MQLANWARITVDQSMLKDLNLRLFQCSQKCAEANRCCPHKSGIVNAFSRLLCGRSVLARRKQDGHFYAGIVQEVQTAHISDRVLVRFGPFQSVRRSASCSRNLLACTDGYLYESIPITDIIDLQYALKHPVELYDKVLVPELWPIPRCAVHPSKECRLLKHARYHPGTVVAGKEKRGQIGTNNMNRLLDSTQKTLTVALANNNYRVGNHQVPANQAVWISKVMFDRITVEQIMPASAREWLRHKTLVPCTYPKQSAPGYPSDEPLKRSDNFSRSAKPANCLQFVEGPQVQMDFGTDARIQQLVPVYDALLCAPHKECEETESRPANKLMCHSLPRRSHHHQFGQHSRPTMDL
ncbi:hypothetical protein EG68_07975 [Paragonimus skrjabini miyazakii]|uniref:DUF4537 domain-containing protein n=1 Tax=Paragonimus skrjabini miyazakii TaxID=59628 RepID=A0A8S9YLD1_9TREM|nr:hypothetical protein EG68_07975 [Paragonimus skrjabini miyazakii]